MGASRILLLQYSFKQVESEVLPCCPILDKDGVIVSPLLLSAALIALDIENALLSFWPIGGMYLASFLGHQDISHTLHSYQHRLLPQCLPHCL